MATSGICINYDSSTGDINLLQVGHYIKGNHARRHVEASMKALRMPSRADKKIRGVGKDVLVGTYDEAIKIAEHLGATGEQVEAIKDVLKNMSPPVTGVADLTHHTGQNDSGKPQRAPGSVGPQDEILDVELFPTKETVQTLIGVKDGFPIALDKDTSAWLGYKYHRDARYAVRKVEADGDIMRGVDFDELELGINHATGHTIKEYCFTVDGFKEFCIMLNSGKSKMVRRYFLEIERETRKRVSKQLFKDIQKAACNTAKKTKLKSTKATESHIRDRLSRAIGGVVEVPCLFGRVDILSDTHVIEIKAVAQYKSAIGQVMTYSQCFPDKRRRIHLFGDEARDMNRFKKAHMACKQLDIDVSVEFL